MSSLTSFLACLRAGGARAAAEGSRPPRRWFAGFTLVELMIVLAIIAVISAYAVPAYQDYLARSRVGEGFALAAAAQLQVAENALSGDPLDAGYVPPRPTANVRAVQIMGDTGEVVLTFQPRVAAAGANTLVLVPSSAGPAGRVALTAGAPPPGALNWECFAAGKDASRLADPGPLPSTAPTLPSRLAVGDCR